MNARDSNGTVSVPKWLLWVVGVVFTAFIGWAVRDRERIGERLQNIDARLTREEAVDEATQADLARLRETIRAYIDTRLREGGIEQ